MQLAFTRVIFKKTCSLEVGLALDSSVKKHGVPATAKAVENPVKDLSAETAALRS
jgi:hypothetical protein